MSQIIRLLIADDHPVVRDGLGGIFEASGEFEVAGEAANGREAVDRAAALHPDVVLMDLRMPVQDGVSSIKMLAEKGIGEEELPLQFSAAPQPRAKERRLLPGTQPSVSYLAEYRTGEDPPDRRRGL